MQRTERRNEYKFAIEANTRKVWNIYNNKGKKTATAVLTLLVFLVENALGGLNREHFVEHVFHLQLQDDYQCWNQQTWLGL